MADKTWAGTTDANVATAGNWSGGTVPAGGDNIFWLGITPFPMSGTFTNAVGAGNVTVSEQAGAQAGNGGNTFGTASTPIDFNGNVTGTIRIALRGNAYVASGGDTLTSVSLEMPDGFVGVFSGTQTVTSITASKCRVDVGASTVIVSGYSIGAFWDVATSGTAITLFEGSGRITSTSRGITTATIEPGGLVVVAGTSAVGTVNISRGAVFNHQSSGTVTTGNIRPGGLYTVKGNSTTGATLSTAVIWQGGQLVEVSEGFTLTVTAKSYRGPQSGGGFSLS